MGVRAKLLLLVLPALLAAAGTTRADDPPAAAVVVTGTLAAAAEWSGTVTVEGKVTVPEGIVLTLRPGTTVLLREGAGIEVAGTLLAEGTAAQPILMRPAGDGAPPGSWEGLSFSGASSPSLLRHCRITGARAIAVTAGAHRIAESEIEGGAMGLVTTGRESEPVLEGSRIHDLLESGVDASGGSRPVIRGNRIERCAKAGVAAFQGAIPQVAGNTISRCGAGISLARTAPEIRGNVLEDNEQGIALNLVSGGHPIQDNLVAGNRLGILCENFSDPVLLHNTVERNEEGIVCYQGARPLIRLNRVAGNKAGVKCIQLSNPTIARNSFEDNATAIYLHLSSYAVIRENDFAHNKLHVELDNMSSDWERRVGKKPARGRTRQAMGQAETIGGRPAADADGAEIPDAVDAVGNWWGPETTREMEERGADADIEAIRDYHDVPTRAYEGYPGEYEQDRVRYAPWAGAPFAGRDGERPGRREGAPGAP